MRVLIIADNAVTANGINLEMRHATGCHVTGFLNGRRPCAPHVAEEAPDVVVMDDLRDRELTLARIREVRAAVPGAKVLLLTLRMEPDWLAEVSEAGIDAAIAKIARPGSIGALVREVVRGNVFHAFARRAAAEPPALHDLTARELEILQLVASGNSNRRIAQRLWVTEQTVKFHLSNVYRKLGVANRTEASHVAHQQGLLQATPPPRFAGGPDPQSPAVPEAA
jgi:DNA-binding NarL/FixJ family response regulator